MGKRSEFERVEKDFYRTIDARAAKALIPHLAEHTRFIEPCAGLGDLVTELEAYDHKCVWASDSNIDEEFLKEVPARIRTCDAFSVQFGRTDIVNSYDAIITNPPWSRPILHPMIEHFSKFKPTWLLFDADWAHTRQSAPYMKWCRKIVSVGRLIWIPGTTMSGKDNVSWYCFDQNSEGVTEFYGR